MIIQSVRLKNIKSYGAGAQGMGVTVTFQKGINRIAGRNGHGKSTLIEAIGYALFLVEPEFEENFRKERYFLSHGEAAGEIDVTFEHGNVSYRVECGIGGHLRHKVIQVIDGSCCADGKAEVKRFLGSLLRFGDPKLLGEMFSKLVGVRQGRLTWPFDSKTAAAKDFFEPLLDVAVYGECFDKLKPVVEEFEGQEHGLDTQRAGLAQKIQDRADSGGRVEELGRTISETETRLQEALKERDAAQEGKKAQELLEREATASRSEAERCDILWKGKKSERETAQRAVDASVRAAEVVQANAVAHTGYEQATNRLASLEQQRAKRDQLQKERGVTDLERERSGGAALAAR
ncbi:MAG: AAA family ATPase, partial [Verrucomicrobia bacterium]|nr:AAA family ATPase [Verrucomicrobiota bacterium]